MEAASRSATLQPMETLVVVARLLPGKTVEAERLVAGGPPFDPSELGFHRHSVFLTATDVVFLFEAPGVEWIVDDIVNDQVVSAAFGPWRPLLDGPPRLAHERYAWRRAAVDDTHVKA